MLGEHGDLKCYISKIMSTVAWLRSRLECADVHGLVFIGLERIEGRLERIGDFNGLERI